MKRVISSACLFAKNVYQGSACRQVNASALPVITVITVNLVSFDLWEFSLPVYRSFYISCIKIQFTSSIFFIIVCRNLINLFVLTTKRSKGYISRWNKPTFLRVTSANNFHPPSRFWNRYSTVFFPLSFPLQHRVRRVSRENGKVTIRCSLVIAPLLSRKKKRRKMREIQGF